MALDFDAIFTAMYSQFRADSDVPTSSDDEYTVGLRLANEAIRYWENYDGTKWKELYATNQLDGTGAQVIVMGQKTYTAPTNFKEAGGIARVVDSNGNDQIRYPIVESNEVQFLDTNSTFCYFTGSPKDTTYTLHLNPAPTSNLSGMDIDYVYYKTATLFTTGTDKTEMSNPYFIVHRVLGNEFRASRNPYYASAIKDAESALRIMQLDNNAGTWGNTPTLTDTSGTAWGS